MKQTNKEALKQTPKSKVKSDGNQTAKSNAIPRNVNHYRHLLENPACTEFDINWILKLRDNHEIKL
jgi:hypothetical protein